MMAGAAAYWAANPLPVRFWKRVDRRGEAECWPWTGARNAYGYGVIWNAGKVLIATRVMLELQGSPVPTGKVLDHLCRNRWCVNPAHLRAITQSVNARENSTSPFAINAQKTHCLRGHAFDLIEQTRRGPIRGCSECKKIRAARAVAKQREKRAARSVTSTGVSE